MKELSPVQVPVSPSRKRAPSSIRPRVSMTCASACWAQGSLRLSANAVRAACSASRADGIARTRMPPCRARRQRPLQFEHFENGPQHGGRVAAIELEILLQLDHGEIARETIRHVAAQPHGRGHVADDPGSKHGGIHLLPSVLRPASAPPPDSRGPPARRHRAPRAASRAVPRRRSRGSNPRPHWRQARCLRSGSRTTESPR